MNNYAIVSSLNISTIILLLFSIYIFWNLILERISNKENVIEYVLNNDSIRPPFGYILIAIGFIIRIFVLLPLPFFGELHRLDLVTYWEFYVKAFSQFFSSIFVFVGIAFMMWPTLKKYYIVITKTPADNKRISLYYLLFCLLLFSLGVLLHEGLILLLR